MTTALAVYQQGGNPVNADGFNTFTQSCDVFADLRAFVGTDGIQVFARGKTTVDDGSQGYFYWDTSQVAPVDDNDDTIVPYGSSGACWTRITTDVPISPYMAGLLRSTTQAAARSYLGIGSNLSIISALDYGVTGNGVTDDSAAINAFLATASTLGAMAYFPQNLTYNLGYSGIVVPDYLRVICGENSVFLRSLYPPTGTLGFGSYLSCMVSLGNRCRWQGGTLSNTAVMTTSSTSQAVATGSKTFTVPAGLTLVPTLSLRIWSAANAANNMEGTITSYSGTTLVFSSNFAAGSGTHTDWQIGVASVYQCAMVAHDRVNTIVEDCLAVGFWYIGFLVDGWNPPTGGSNITTECTFRTCYATSIQNRSFYIFGTITKCIFDGCIANGGGEITDYGFNINPANGIGTANAIAYCQFVSCEAHSMFGHSYGLGDNVSHILFQGCMAAANTGVGPVGFDVASANTGEPAFINMFGCQSISIGNIGFLVAGAPYINMVGCDAISCANVGFLVENNVNDSPYVSMTGCTARFCDIGFFIEPGVARCDMNDIDALANTTDGVVIQTGCQITIASGRSFANGVSNIADAGTGSVIANLVTT